MKTFLVFLFSIHIVVESVWQNPGFCGTYECPEYTLDEQGKGYEKRFYATATWVSTSAAGSYKNATTTTFSKLQSYLKQLNAEAMAVPYVTMMFPTVGLNVVQNFTQFFFIKPSLRPAPEPIDTSIQLKDRSGHVTSTADWVKQANLLAGAINDTSKILRYIFFTAEYNLPSESGKTMKCGSMQ
ncbi:unnamed protein product [Mytilus edulis]|uniref:Heme-binding protein 2 n=1 Tax=Mytilus edulis TaxID=6550 RepID=A0A8S3QXC4_MYTED|nr:unnamed protein product [Mytilus edulis]